MPMPAASSQNRLVYRSCLTPVLCRQSRLQTKRHIRNKRPPLILSLLDHHPRSQSGALNTRLQMLIANRNSIKHILFYTILTAQDPHKRHHWCMDLRGRNLEDTLAVGYRYCRPVVLRSLSFARIRHGDCEKSER
jgi:hypothetical protein